MIFKAITFDGIDIEVRGGNVTFAEDVTLSNTEMGIINMSGKIVGEERVRFENVKQRERELQEKKRREPYTCPVTGMEFVFVKGGKFKMGDIWGDGDDDEKPVHEIELDDFYMGKYPVTQGQWKKVM